MRIRLSDLSPGITYALQLRTNTGDAVSEWSRIFYVTTSSDTLAPKVPASVAGTMDGTSFNLSWAKVIESSDNSPATDLDHYEVLVSSTGTGTTGLYLVNDTKFQFTLDLNRTLFGSPRANVIMQVRAVDKTGNASAYSSNVSQTNATPANPANFTATGAPDTILLKWDAVADADLIYYRVYSGTVVGTQTTLVWQGSATSATIPSTLYSSDRWYKVTAVDVFTSEGTGTVAGPVRPDSPFILDSVPPAVPAGLTATLTTATDTTTSAQVSWTAVTDTDGDLAEYVVDYRPVGASDWQTVKVDYTKTSVKIDRLTPYVNYEFRIRSSDFQANLSAWSSTFTTNTAASNTAPAQVTGLIGVAGASTVTVLWTESADNDVKNGAGMYEVQMDTANTFATGNLQTIKTAATVASFFTTGLPAGNRYVRVRAVDSLGLAGSYSSTLTLNQTDLAATEAYTQSRGMNLVTNGTGGLGTNKNFSTLTFDAADRPFGGGSFKTGVVAGPQVHESDELMPVDTAKSYVQTVYARQCIVGQVGARFYAGIVAYDVDGNQIGAQSHMYLPNTTTTLAVTLVPGATTVTLTSAANWQNATGAGHYQKGFIFWNYTDGKGYTYPTNTYSRNFYVENTNGMWNNGGISGNVITLRVPWAGPTIASGTAVSNSNSGGVYKYITASNVIGPQVWTKYQGRIGGLDLTGGNVNTQFSPGTAYVKTLFLSHYPTLTGGFNSQMAYAGINLTDVDGANLLPSTMGGDVVIANTLAGDRVIANSLDANTLKANTAFVQDLSVKSTFTLGDASTDGVIKSYDYTTSGGTTGFSLAKSGLVIKTGIIEAAALKIQASPNLMPGQYASFEYGNKYYIDPFWNPLGKAGMFTGNGICDVTTTAASIFKGKQALSISQPFNTNAVTAYFGLSATDYNISVEPGKTYIISAYMRNTVANTETWNVRVKGDNAANLVTTPYALGASEAALVRRSFALTIPAGVNKVLLWMEKPGATFSAGLHIDGVQFEEKTGADNTPSVWKPPGGTTIDGGGITTGVIQSNSTISVGGVDQPTWSINTAGNMQIGDALVRGKLIIGVGDEDLPNRAPGNGDFETNITGYSVYHSGATSPAIARTTTGGEVITGVGSAKVTAAAGAKASLGMSFATPMTYLPGTTVRVRGNVKVNTTDASSIIGCFMWNAALGAVSSQTAVTSPVANTVYSFDVSYTVQESEDVAVIILTHQTGTATSVIFDDVVMTADNEIGASYVQSANFISGEGGTGWKIDGQGNAEFNQGFFRGTLGAGIVTSETLSSTITVSTLFRTAESGKRVEFNGDGIIAYRQDGTARVSIPTDDSTAASFDGDLLAQSLTVSGSMAIRGENNEFSKGSIVTLQSGTTAPNSPPTVTVDWKTYSTAGDPAFDKYRYGITVQGGWFRIPVQLYGYGVVVESYHMTTGVKQYGSLATNANDGMWTNLGGITSIGNSVYMLGTNKAGAWRIMGWTFGTGVSGTPTRFLNAAYTQYSDHRMPAIGNDGTNLLIAFTNTGSGLVQYRTFNATTGAQIGSAIATNVNMASDMASINKGVFDNGFGAGGAAVTVITSRNHVTAWVLNGTTGQHTSNWNFPLPSKPSGQCYSGGKFYTHDAVGGQITEHTGISWNASTSGYGVWHAVNTWYNTDATNGNKETVMGQVKTFTMKQRARVTITSPPIPIRPVPNTVDDATATGVYLARNSTTPGRTLLERQGYLADAVRTVTYDTVTLPAPGVAASFPPPATSNFPASSPAVLRSDTDKFVLNGDGSGVWGDMTIPVGSNAVTHSARQYTVSLATNWAAFGSPHGTPRFYRTADGAWVGSGMFKNTSALSISSAGVLMGTIPASSYASAIIQLAAITTATASATGWYIFVNTTGEVYLRIGSGTAVNLPINSFVSLAGIVFHEAAS